MKRRRGRVQPGLPLPPPDQPIRALLPEQRRRVANLARRLVELALTEMDNTYDDSAGPYLAAWGLSFVRHVRNCADRIEFEVSLREVKKP